MVYSWINQKLLHQKLQRNPYRLICICIYLFICALVFDTYLYILQQGNSTDWIRSWLASTFSRTWRWRGTRWTRRPWWSDTHTYTQTNGWEKVEAWSSTIRRCLLVKKPKVGRRRQCWWRWCCPKILQQMWSHTIHWWVHVLQHLNGLWLYVSFVNWETRWCEPRKVWGCWGWEGKGREYRRPHVLTERHVPETSVTQWSRNMLEPGLLRLWGGKEK